MPAGTQKQEHSMPAATQRAGNRPLTSGRTNPASLMTPNQEHPPKGNKAAMARQANGRSRQHLSGEFSYPLAISCLQ